MRNITQRASLVLLLSLLSGVAHAAGPAPMTYQTPNGKSASVLLMTSVGSDGQPLVQSYTGPDGKSHSPLVQAQICSVESGTPYLCAAEAGSNSALILSSSGSPSSSGTWPTTDPLVAGQAWQNGGVMMLSTGSAARPTFDGSGLANVATLNSSGQLTAPLATTGASTTGALTVTSSGASLTGVVSGTTKKWVLGRRPQDTYISLQSYSGSSWQHLTLNDDGSVETGLGYLANLGADAAFSGLVSAATLKSTGDAEFSGNIALDNGKAMTFHGPSGTTAASSYMYGDGSGNIAVSGSMTVPMLTVSTAATVPDTSTSDSSAAALNTESAAARFIDKETVAANYQTIQDMSVYVRSVSGDLTNPVITGASLSGKTSIDGGKITTDGSGNMAVSGSLTATTPATTDNSTNVATTAFVNNAFQAVEYSVQGDISTSGSSIQIPFGTSGLYAKFAYTGSGSASMSFYATSGTLSPVDIRRNSIWGGSGVETYTLDNGSVGTAGVVADSTVYTQSQDSSAYFIRVGGQVYFLTVWASNNGARAFMGVHKMI